MRSTRLPSTRRTTIRRLHLGQKRPRSGAGSSSTAQYGHATGVTARGSAEAAGGSAGTPRSGPGSARSSTPDRLSVPVSGLPPPRRRLRKPISVPRAALACAQGTPQVGRRARRSLTLGPEQPGLDQATTRAAGSPRSAQSRADSGAAPAADVPYVARITRSASPSGSAPLPVMVSWNSRSAGTGTSAAAIPVKPCAASQSPRIRRMSRQPVR